MKKFGSENQGISMGGIQTKPLNLRLWSKLHKMGLDNQRISWSKPYNRYLHGAPCKRQENWQKVLRHNETKGPFQGLLFLEKDTELIS